jgi:CubicO group peptidase (beta-lactamase class C family)
MSREFLPVPLPTELDALFGQYVAAQQAPGLVYGLIGPEGLVHSAGFGTADGTAIDTGHGRTHDKAAPDAETVFPIASITKSFVAAGALLAGERGLLDLDAPSSALLPEVPATVNAHGTYPAPSIRQFLGMGGGLTEDNAWIDQFVGMPTEDLLATVAEGLIFSNPPGVAFEYSNLGYALVGVALTRAVGAPLPTWLTENLLMPLGLASTRFDSAPLPDGARRATGFTLDAAGGWTGFAPMSSDAFASAAGLQSTVRDLATWAAYLGAPFREADSDGPLSAAARRDMQRVHHPYPPPEIPPGIAAGPFQKATIGYGLGLVVRDDPTWGTIVSHSGGLPGFTLHLVWHPDSGNGTVVLTNSHRGTPAMLAEEALTRALSSNGAPARTIRLWPQTARLLEAAERLIRSWDDAAAAEILAPNVAPDRPLGDRRADLERQLATVGPLLPPRAPGSRPDLVVTASPAHIIWAIGAERGELLCHIHVTPLRNAKIQTFEVVARPYDVPRGARLAQIPAQTSIHAVPAPARHGRVIWPDPTE